MIVNGRGYAAVSFKRSIIVDTVSSTKRAAMVNWLVTEDNAIVYPWETDEDIECRFNERAGHRGFAFISVVHIDIVDAAV